MLKTDTSTLRVGQFSAYYGDRAETFRELLDSDVDILTGDYLAELTMLVLHKNRSRGGNGYAEGFVRQIRPFLAEIAEKGVKVITNAGGLDPVGCAEAIRSAAAEFGVKLTVAAIDGDDVIDKIPDLLAHGEELRNLDTGEVPDLDAQPILTANAYLGAWPIVAALESGADIVITPRVTDASLIMAPAAWHFGWNANDFDYLAGALWAGHAIECGGQVTGGNYSFFTEHEDLGLPGMPIAEIAADGSCVITKATGTGGVVTVDTVRAQMMYEVGGPEYHNPDVVARLDTVQVEQAGPDAVRIYGATGTQPSDATKLSLTYEGGWKNSAIIGMTGRHMQEKLAWLKRQIRRAVGDESSFDRFRYTVVGPESVSDGNLEQSTALVFVSVLDRDPAKVGRRNFADPIVQLGTNNEPGLFFAVPPQREKLAGVQWPCLVPKSVLHPRVLISGLDPIEVEWTAATGGARADGAALSSTDADIADRDWSQKTVNVAFGDVYGTRSGDKAGLANLGVWARTTEQFEWLVNYLTVDELTSLLQELEGLRVVRHVYPNLQAMNFVVYGYLEDGVGACTRLDNQAKGLGEYLGSRIVEIPSEIVGAIENGGAR
ncbi:acyclic terpene utilization AtuA family protein [Dietzia sp. CH92]|uniref:acyclic terpene utilization AtuA family protein n=1 Tax=Dietzia sp. CH92 TaxID=3051823 RepID=UPI0028D13371|nr:acyclic terpene utilization AtuA family protein [Dietzia sp. CH92]